MAKNQPMSNNNADRLAWTRRDFVRAAGGVVAVGAYARRGILPAFAADPVSNLDDLARSVRGQLLRRNSPGYDEARRVWNLAYDRRPLAIVRAVNLEDVQRCVDSVRHLCANEIASK
jgi:hypothetical protein